MIEECLVIDLSTWIIWMRGWFWVRLKALAFLAPHVASGSYHGLRRRSGDLKLRAMLPSELIYFPQAVRMLFEKDPPKCKTPVGDGRDSRGLLPPIEAENFVRHQSTTQEANPVSRILYGQPPQKCPIYNHFRSSNSGVTTSQLFEGVNRVSWVGAWSANPQYVERSIISPGLLQNVYIPRTDLHKRLKRSSSPVPANFYQAAHSMRRWPQSRVAHFRWINPPFQTYSPGDRGCQQNHKVEVTRRTRWKARRGTSWRRNYHHRSIVSFRFTMIVWMCKDFRSIPQTNWIPPCAEAFRGWVMPLMDSDYFVKDHGPSRWGVPPLLPVRSREQMERRCSRIPEQKYTKNSTMDLPQHPKFHDGFSTVRPQHFGLDVGCGIFQKPAASLPSSRITSLRPCQALAWSHQGFRMIWWVERQREQRRQLKMRYSNRYAI